MVTHFIIPYHISLVNVQINYCNNNILKFDVKQLNKIMKLYYFYTLKTLWDGQGKIKFKMQLSGKRSINIRSSLSDSFFLIKSFLEPMKQVKTSYELQTSRVKDFTFKIIFPLYLIINSWVSFLKKQEIIRDNFIFEVFNES